MSSCIPSLQNSEVINWGRSSIHVGIRNAAPALDDCVGRTSCTTLDFVKGNLLFWSKTPLNVALIFCFLVFYFHLLSARWSLHCSGIPSLSASFPILLETLRMEPFPKGMLGPPSSSSLTSDFNYLALCMLPIHHSEAEESIDSFASLVSPIASIFQVQRFESSFSWILLKHAVSFYLKVMSSFFLCFASSLHIYIEKNQTKP